MGRKHTKTPEQRQAEMDALRESITTQVTALADTDQWKAMLRAMTKFHRYSLNNLLLILAQRPDATQVAGYGAWRKDHGRQVRKGERGIKIIAGATYKTTQINPTTGQEEETTRPRFFPTTVFDIAQTDPIEGEAVDLDGLTLTLEGEDTAGITAATTNWLEGLGWTVTRETIPGETNGYMNPTTRTVVVDPALSPAQAAKTVLHEAAHVVLHAEDAPGEYTTHRGVKETEAESVAYVVAGALGMDTAGYSIGYIAGWSEADAELIKSTAENVRKAAATVLEAVEAQLQGQQEEELAA